MMVMLVEQRLPVTKCLVGGVHNPSEAIGIRQDASEGDEATITRVIGRFGRNHPTDEEMRNWRHAF